MAAGRYNLEIEQGADWGRTLQLYDEDVVINLTGYSFAGKIRFEKGAIATMAVFTTAITNAEEGIIYISLANSTTSGLTAGTAYYDLEMTYPDSTKIRLLEGMINITREVTR